MVESETSRVSEEHTERPAVPGQSKNVAPKKKKKGALLRALREQNELLAQQNQALAARLTRQDATLSELTSTVAALAAREPQAAAPLATKQEEDAELAQQLREIKKEIANQALATLRGENPTGRARIKEYLSEFRAFATEMGGMKAELEAASVALGNGAKQVAETDFADTAEKLAGAAERISQTSIGRKVLTKLGMGDEANTPALEHKPSEAEVNAAYG